MKLVNLTPHALTVCGDDGLEITEIPASGQVARVSTRAVATGMFIAGRPVVQNVFGHIVGLPEPDGETIFIVSLFVLQACQRTGRDDVVAPDTGATCVRDADGKVVGVRQFIT